MPGPSWEAMKRVHDHFAGVAASFIESGDEVTAQLFIVRLDETGEVSGVVAVPPEQMEQFMRSEQSKDQFAALMRALLTPGTAPYKSVAQMLKGAPDLLVQINEVWVTLAPVQDAGSVTPPSQSPSRKEALLVTVHTVERSVPVMHPIHDEPRRHAQVMPFPGAGEEEGFAGRFVLNRPDSTLH